MVEIGRGTTPKMTFLVPFTEADLETAYVTFSQGNVVVLEKTKDDFDFVGKEVHISFSQEDTLAFDEDRPCEVQLRFKCADGSAFKSKIKTAMVGRILKDGII